MDSVIGQDFKNELPIIVSKTMGPAIGKSIGLYVGNEAAARANPFLGLAAGALTKVVSKEMNSADVRTWTTLPKNFKSPASPHPPIASWNWPPPAASKRRGNPPAHG